MRLSRWRPRNDFNELRTFIGPTPITLRAPRPRRFSAQNIGAYPDGVNGARDPVSSPASGLIATAHWTKLAPWRKAMPLLSLLKRQLVRRREGRHPRLPCLQRGGRKKDTPQVTPWPPSDARRSFSHWRFSL